VCKFVVCGVWCVVCVFVCLCLCICVVCVCVCVCMYVVSLCVCLCVCVRVCVCSLYCASELSQLDVEFHSLYASGVMKCVDGWRRIARKLWLFLYSISSLDQTRCCCFIQLSHVCLRITYSGVARDFL